MELNQLKKQEGVLWLRFKGENLEKRSIPIYELGQILISIQQIVTKAYLYDKKRMDAHAISNKKREELALQLAYHEKGSDLYGFTSFVGTIVGNEHFIKIIMSIITALTGYGAERLISIIKKKRPSKKELDELPGDRLLSAFIFSQVYNIFKRIDAIGSIKNIEISTKIKKKIHKVELTIDTKNAVRALQEVNFLGGKEEEKEIKGVVTRLNMKKNVVRVETEPHDVNIKLTNEDFRAIRLSRRKFVECRFIARPEYRFGIEKLKTNDYEGRLLEFC